MVTIKNCYSLTDQKLRIELSNGQKLTVRVDAITGKAILTQKIEEESPDCSICGRHVAFHDDKVCKPTKNRCGCREFGQTGHCLHTSLRQFGD